MAADARAKLAAAPGDGPCRRRGVSAAEVEVLRSRLGEGNSAAAQTSGAKGTIRPERFANTPTHARAESNRLV